MKLNYSTPDITIVKMETTAHIMENSDAVTGVSLDSTPTETMESRQSGRGMWDDED